MRLGKLIVNALALVVASLIVPHIKLKLNVQNSYIYLVALALIFGLINTFIRPIAKLISLPINLITLGLFGFVVNGLMLILLAWIMGQLQHNPYVFQVGRLSAELQRRHADRRHPRCDRDQHRLDRPRLVPARQVAGTGAARFPGSPV